MEIFPTYSKSWIYPYIKFHGMFEISKSRDRKISTPTTANNKTAARLKAKTITGPPAGGNTNEIVNIIHSVVIEEMLQMSIAAHVMNALGGAPAINTNVLVPDYPTSLQRGIGGDLKVWLEKDSPDVAAE